jgi:hypothetical protein
MKRLTAPQRPCPVERQDYYAARRRVAEAALLDESSEPWTALRDYLLDDEPEFASESERLSHSLSVPIATLKPTLDALEKAEAAVLAAYKFASGFVDANQSDGDLSAVRAFGTNLAVAADAVRAELDEVA